MTLSHAEMASHTQALDRWAPQTNLPKTLPAMIAQAASLYPQRDAIIDGQQRINYGSLWQQSQQVAACLIALGIETGDRVAIWAPNLSEWILAACGIHAAGAIMVPLNTRMKGSEAVDILDRSQAKVLFCIGNFLGQYYPSMLAGIRPRTLQHVVVLREGFDANQSDSSDMDWRQFLEKATPASHSKVTDRIAQLTEDSTADLMFTSGTTGRPKGVMAAHGPTIRAFSAWGRVVGLQQDDRYLIVNPFFHSFGYKAGWVAAFIQGATVYPEQVFEAEAVLTRIAQEKISFLPGPPTLFLSMLAHPQLKNFDISSLRVAVTGSANVPPILITRMREELGIDNVTTAYGLTECGGCATVCDPQDSAETVASTCGRAIPGTEIRCVDANGQSVPTGEPGEVLLRGYHVMQGYFGDEVATREAIDSEGWLHTGDVGVLNEYGYLKITDRLKDMFILGGFNCYPAEIERLLADHPAIAQVAVVGLPDERMGEVGCACVILRDGAQLSAEELIAWSRNHMANYKVPRHVLFCSQFPLNASNKVLKRELVDIAKSKFLASAH
jgi:acyl-CoA synthetase (AMP-forming)/AMP-acid ligase II